MFCLAEMSLPQFGNPLCRCSHIISLFPSCNAQYLPFCHLLLIVLVSFPVLEFSHLPLQKMGQLSHRRKTRDTFPLEQASRSVLQDIAEEDPVMPTAWLEEAGQAAELLRRELRWPLVLALLQAGSKGGYDRVSARDHVTASLPQWKYNTLLSTTLVFRRKVVWQEGCHLASSTGWGARRLGCLPVWAPGSYLVFLFPHLYNRVNKDSLPHSDDVKLSSFMFVRCYNGQHNRNQ